MTDWILYSKNAGLPPLSGFHYQFENSNYILAISNKKYQGIIKPGKNEALFVFGYIMPRLNFNISNDIYENLLDGIKNKGPEYLLNFKGNFIVIAVYNNKFLLLNDQFGINKYFFLKKEDVFIASDHISFIKEHKHPEISRENILKYYLFNYFIDGITIFRDCFYSQGGTYHIIEEKAETNRYFSIKEFIDERKIKYSKKESIQKSSALWEAIINQYLTFFKGKRISQTLTAGMDSRLILAGFRKNNFNPSTFTFGRIDSMDVVHAKKVASKLKLKHEHIFPEQSFFTNFSDEAKEVIQMSSGMATLFRAHRMNAYKTMKNNYDVLFFGFIGSEIIRGLFPDRLLVPGIVTDYWLNGDIDLKDYFPAEWFDFQEKELIDIKEEIVKYDLFDRPDLLLFRLMIPLHFAQDIKLNDSLGVISVAPYWDIDFLDFQKNTIFFTDNTRKEDFAKLGHYMRRKGPYFSANLIKTLDRENARMSLGKGYSPSDYVFSLYYAAARFIFYKTFFGKQYAIPNFDYTEWFRKYLISYIENNPILFLAKDKNDLIKYIGNIHGHDELSFLNIAKVININMIIREL